MKYAWLFMVVCWLGSFSTAFATAPIEWNPAEFRGRSPYEVLGVAKTAFDDEIKKAYRRAMKHFHPDHYGNKSKAEQDQAAAEAQMVNMAYEFLNDPVKRASWDSGAPWSRPQPPPQRPQPRPESRRPDPEPEKQSSGFARENGFKPLTKMPWYNVTKSYNENLIIAFSSSVDDKTILHWMGASTYGYKPELLRRNLENYLQAMIDGVKNAFPQSVTDPQMKQKFEKHMQGLRNTLSRPMVKRQFPELIVKLHKDLPAAWANQIVDPPAESPPFGTRSSSYSQERVRPLKEMPWYLNDLSYDDNFIFALARTDVDDPTLLEWMKLSRFATDALSLKGAVLSLIQNLAMELNRHSALYMRSPNFQVQKASYDQVLLQMNSLRQVLSRPILLRIPELRSSLRSQISSYFFNLIVNPADHPEGGSCRNPHW